MKRTSLEKLTVAKLKEIAKENGIKLLSKLKKAEIIDELEAFFIANELLGEYTVDVNTVNTNGFVNRVCGRDILDNIENDVIDYEELFDFIPDEIVTTPLLINDMEQNGNVSIVDYNNYTFTEVDTVDVNIKTVNLDRLNVCFFGDIEETNEFYPCVLGKDFLCNSHKEYLIEGLKNEFLEERIANVRVAKVHSSGKVAKVTNLDEYTYLREKYGVKAIDCPFDNIVPLKDINYDEMSKDFDGIFFTKNVVRELKNVNEEYSLITLNGSTIKFFGNKPIIGVKPYVVENTEKAVEKAYSYISKGTPIKKQFRVLKFEIENLEYNKEKDMYSLPMNKGIEVAMSESRLFRTFNNNDGTVPFVMFKGAPSNKDWFHVNAKGFVTNNENDPKKYIKRTNRKDFKDIGEDMKSHIANMHMRLLSIVEKGIFISRDNKVYEIITQSASQNRAGKFTMTCLDTKAVRKELVCGCTQYTQGNSFSLAEMLAREGLAMTNTWEISSIKNPKIEVLKDKDVTVKVKFIEPTNVDKENCICSILDENGIDLGVSKIQEKDFSFTPNDGAGLIEFIPAMKCAKDLGLITEKDYDFFVENFKGIKYFKDKTDEELTKEDIRVRKLIMDSPSAYQIRHGGDKGLLLVFPFSEYRPDLSEFEMVMGSNMRKYKLSEEQWATVPFEVAKWEVTPREMISFSYQFFQNTDITSEELIKLAERAFVKIDKDILVNAQSAMNFLGLVYSTSSVEDDNTDDNSIASNLSLTLTNDPDFLHDVYCQRKIKKLLGKYVFGLCFGKIPVAGDFHFVVSDPFHFLGEGEKNINELTDLSMNKGENYLNNRNEKVGIFRAPMIHKSEAQIINLVENNKLWFITNILVLNPYEPTLPVGGGADTDGDTFAVTNEPAILNSIAQNQPLPLNVDLNKKKILEYNNVEEELKRHFSNGGVQSQIGLVADLATKWRDLELTNPSVDNNTQLLALRFLSGWEIDKAKTGASVDTPEILEVKNTPHWRQAMKFFYEDTEKAISNPNSVRVKVTEKMILNEEDKYNKKKNVYKSFSPLGQLFTAYFKKAESLLTTVPEKTINFTSKLSRFANIPEVERIYCDMAELDTCFRKDINIIMDSYPDVDDNIKRKEAMNALKERYRPLVYSVSNDKISLAYTAYAVAYNRPQNNSKSRSFPWMILFDEMMDLISLGKNSKKLVRLPKYHEKIQDVTVFNGVLYLNNKMHSIVKIENGKYEVKTINNSDFILVATKAPKYEKEEVVAPENKIYNVVISGHKRNNVDKDTLINGLITGFIMCQNEDGYYELIDVNTGEYLTSIASRDALKVQGVSTNVFKATYIGEVERINKQGVLALLGSININFKAFGGYTPPTNPDTTSNEEYVDYSDNEYMDYSNEDNFDSCMYEETYEEVYEAPQELTVNQKVMNKFGVQLPETLVMPAGMTNVEFIPNGSFGIVRAYAGNKAFDYKIIQQGGGLNVTGNNNPSQEAIVFMIYYALTQLV